MSLSNAQGAKRALYDALKAATYTDPQPGVWHGSPNVDHDFHDNVIVAPAENPVTFDQDRLTMGALAASRTRTEIIEIPIRVEVFREGTDEFAASDRAWELAEAIATVLAADQTLDGSTRDASPTAGDWTDQPFQEGRRVALTLTVSAKSYPTGV